MDGGGLLHRLEERRGRADGQVDVSHHQHLTSRHEGFALRHADQPAGLVHAQGCPGALDYDQVGMGAGQHPAAGVAFTAPSVRTQQGGSEAASGRSGPRAGRTTEQIGVDRIVGGGPERGHGGGLTHDLVEESEGRKVAVRGDGDHAGRPTSPRVVREGGSPSRDRTTSATWDATSATGWVPSTTAHSSGSERARATKP